MSKVVTFGEVMLRLSTPNHSRFVQSTQFNATYGGGEANVAVSLAQLGIRSAHVTRFPDNELGKAATHQLRGYGVDTDAIVFGGHRMGLYFLETGSSVRPSKIIYDRAGSSFSDITPDMLNWDEILEGADWFHWTGITPAISRGAADCCKKAIEVANKKGITVSGDINYRKNLWQYGKKASEIMPDLIAGCDMLVASTHDAEDILGIKVQNSPNKEMEVFQQIITRFPKVKKIVTTKRGSISASHNTLTGHLYNGSEMMKTEVFEVNPIVDRIGGGDAFIAGVIYGQLVYKNDQKSIDFGVAASILKHTIECDANLATVDEVENLMSGNTSGKIIR
ncbi:sugar kinase [Fulvivirga sediminis]|uniref:Sugar kinase n=1 Tax=Fulvivirga sediminis TaxID=2803949 RepID=A0A937JYY0_9BACT|nr:sugar kinase [Fulvivirga sediminis]MBL3656124.1 sugar kinase [Fulvivirga sediminis]